ncbi:CBN-FBXA-84 protein [Caenorhabditis brenneri]|uniref:CBN-FBXA-84 protein n=1 Tax=Caenorhabditis brenneri TaxID=135651 RepID=G0P009_CAEBE|nr:CBN-FBXA-84 protein [Caenorhabditis brenneri]
MEQCLPLKAVYESCENSTRKGQKGFGDMPIEIVDNILEYVDHRFERILMRRVCRGFRDIIDRDIPFYKRISVYHFDSRNPTVKIYLDNDAISYKPEGKGCTMGYGNQKEVSIKKKNFLKMALGHVGYLLHNPHLQLEQFNVMDFKKEGGAGVTQLPYLEQVLSSLNHQLHVSEIDLPKTTLSNHIHLLKHFKPGVLKRIDCYCEGGEDDVNNLFGLDQWRMAENKLIYIDLTGDDSSILMDVVRNSEDFEIGRPELVPEEIAEIKKVLLEMRNFQYGCIFSNKENYAMDIEAIKGALGEFDADRRTPEWPCYPIPGSDKFLVFRFEFKRKNMIEIGRYAAS